MWYIPLDEDMLDSYKLIIIPCESEALADELMEIFQQHGVVWADGTVPTEDSHWETNREETCYFVKRKRLLFGNINLAGSDRYENYVKCVFYGKHETLFEPANDSEMRSFLGF